MPVNNSLIHDQASGLRGLHELSNEKIKVIAVTGGKGGVGKTSVSINMACALADKGNKVMILDADLGLANVDVMLGLRSTKNLFHVVTGEADLDDIIVYGPKGIGILPATSGIQNMTELTLGQYAGLIRAFSEMKSQFNYLVVDTAAGISDMVLSFVKAVQDVVVVVCDEPSSITDAYALMKILSKEHGIVNFKIVANMVKNQQQGKELFYKLNLVSEKFLDVNLELVATIPFDENLIKAVRKQQLIVDINPRSPASKAYLSFANKIQTWKVPEQLNGNLEFFIEQLIDCPILTKDSKCE